MGRQARTRLVAVAPRAVRRSFRRATGLAGSGPAAGVHDPSPDTNAARGGREIPRSSAYEPAAAPAASRHRVEAVGHVARYRYRPRRTSVSHWREPREYGRDPFLADSSLRGIGARQSAGRTNSLDGAQRIVCDGAVDPDNATFLTRSDATMAHRNMRERPSNGA